MLPRMEEKQGRKEKEKRGNEELLLKYGIRQKKIKYGEGCESAVREKRGRQTKMFVNLWGPLRLRS